MTGAVPPLPTEDHPDEIGGEQSSALDGTQVQYRYSTGASYRLTFADGGVVFQQLGGGAPPIGPLPYRARQLREEQVLVHWIVKPASIHVSLVIDFARQRIDAAAMMPPNRWEYFDTGVLEPVG